MNLDPDLGDLEEMLAHVQTQLEYEIDLEKDSKMPSFTNVQESPKMLKKTSSFGKADTLSFRRNGRPPLSRANEFDSGSQSLNGYDMNGDQSEYQLPILNGNGKGSQTSLQSDEAYHVSLKSFRSEPSQRLSLASLPGNVEKKGSTASLNGRSRTATLPRGYGSTKERNWENYWAQ